MTRWLLGVAASAAASASASASPLAELAVSYERLERLVVRLDMAPAAVATADEGLEAAAALFFGRRMNEAAGLLDRAALLMLGLEGDPTARWLTSLEPLDAVPGPGDRLILAPRAAVSTPARPSPEDLAAVRVRLVPDGPAHGSGEDPEFLATGTIAAAEPPGSHPDHGGLVRLDRPLPDGAYRVLAEFAAADGSRPRLLPLGRWTVAAESLDAERRRLEAALREANGADSSMRRRVLARLELLRDQPLPGNLTGRVIDRIDLRSQLRGEVDDLLAGRTPHRNRSGDWWHLLEVGAARWPTRILVPTSARRPGSPPPPLLIALHGAGGNEHLFIDGHGGGRLAGLAEEHGFIVAAPPTTALALGGDFARLLDAIEEIQSFDRDRVWLIGHSLGGMTAAALSGLEPDRIAAAALVAGGGPVVPPAGTTIPPLHYFPAERDRIVPAARVRRAGERSRAAGVPTTITDVQGVGHVLVVSVVLDAAVDWLRQFRRGQ